MRLDWLKSYNLLVFEDVDSTNSEALRMASSGVSGNFVIISNHQSGGRGSKGRAWKSIAGNLHVSILLESISETKNHPQLSFLTANAVYEAIKELAKEKKKKLNIKLKWPNDILINDRKVGGILLESISREKKNYVIIGIGINIIEAPAKVAFPATSLYDERLVLDSSDELLNYVISWFDKLYKQWIMDNNFYRVRKDWMKRAYNLNKTITVDDGNRKLCGIFKEINLDGALCLETNDGEIHNLAAGDVS